MGDVVSSLFVGSLVDAGSHFRQAKETDVIGAESGKEKECLGRRKRSQWRHRRCSISSLHHRRSGPREQLRASPSHVTSGKIMRRTATLHFHWQLVRDKFFRPSVLQRLLGRRHTRLRKCLHFPRALLIALRCYQSMTLTVSGARILRLD